MTRGELGDDSRPGDVNTKAWWQDLSDKGKDNAMYKNSIVQMDPREKIFGFVQFLSHKFILN